MAEAPIASVLRYDPRLYSVVDSVKRWVDSVDYTVFMTYVYDLTPAVNLYDLADQLDVLGVKGWDIAVTEEDKRNLLKSAIELHRYAGTPYAIKRAFKALGFYDVSVVQHVPFLLNGDFLLDGMQTLGSSDWANFKVVVDIGNLRGISPQQSAMALALAEAWAPVYTTCVKVEYAVTMTDEFVNPTDSSGFSMMLLSRDDFFFYLDGSIALDGSRFLDSTDDSVDTEEIY